MKNCIISRIIVLCLIFSILVSPNIVYASDTAAVGLTGDREKVKVSEEFSITLRVEAVKSLYSFVAEIEYDGENISFVNATSGLDGFFHLQKTQNNNYQKIVFTKMGSSTEEKGNVNLCTLNFKALKASDCKIKLKAMEILDADLKNVVFRGVGSSLKIDVINKVPDSEETTDPTPTPPQDNLLIIKPEGKLDEKGTVTAEVQNDNLKDVLDHINGGTVQIEVKAEEKAREVKVFIPLQPLYELEKKQVSSIEVTMGSVNLSFDTDVLSKYMEQKPDKLLLSVLKVDPAALPEEVREKVGNNMVYDFSMQVDGNPVSTFHPGTMKIALPYTLQPGEKPGKVVVYFINDNGKLEIVKNGRFNPAVGKIVFFPRHFSNYMAAYADVTFRDLDGTSWARESIEALAARGSIHGFGNGDFKPEHKITRAQFIKILMQPLELADDDAKSSLWDVREGEWYYSSIAAAEKLGIVKGKEDGSFGTDDEISRQDMMVMAYRAALQVKANLSCEGDKTRFTDEAEIAAYASEAVAAMQGAGVLQGLGDGSFAPSKSATRAEAVVIIYRLYNLVM